MVPSILGDLWWHLIHGFHSLSCVALWAFVTSLPSCCLDEGGVSAYAGGVFSKVCKLILPTSPPHAPK